MIYANSPLFMEIYPGKFSASYRNYFDNNSSLHICKLRLGNSTGNHFKNPLSLAILFIYTSDNEEFAPKHRNLVRPCNWLITY